MLIISCCPLGKVGNKSLDQFGLGLLNEMAITSSTTINYNHLMQYILPI